jgi:hypothetical protein
MTLLDWEEQVAEWIDLGVSDTPLLERMYKLGCTPLSAVDAIRELRELEEYLQVPLLHKPSVFDYESLEDAPEEIFVESWLISSSSSFLG